MAKRKKNERVILEDIELKPQVIGYTYKKRSNFGRVLIIFLAFVLVIYFIDDISVYINNLLGKETAPTISGGASSHKKPIVDDGEHKEVVYNVYKNELSFAQDEMTFTNFNYSNGILTFDIQNDNTKKIDKSSQKYFIETYNESKTLLERRKLDIGVIVEKAKVSFSLDLNKEFYYIVLIEKETDDYPIVNLKNDENGKGIISCTKGNETIEYTFLNNELNLIKDSINNSDINNTNYYNSYIAFQDKANRYNKIEGITATFNGTVNGYSVVFSLNLANVNLEGLDEKNYFSYKEVPKVVKFEMETKGFTCS